MMGIGLPLVVSVTLFGLALSKSDMSCKVISV